MKLQWLALTLRLVALLPLLAYPAVLVANAMQASALLAPTLRQDGTAFRRALMGLFVGGTTLYPLIVGASYAGAARTSDATRELACSVAPLAFLGALAGLVALLAKGDKAG